jgi:GlpG protein
LAIGIAQVAFSVRSWNISGPMRLIGHLESETHAQALGDYLLAQDIDNSVEEDAGTWAVWVHAEESVEKARRLMQEFLRAPEDRKYGKATHTAKLKRAHREQEDAAARKRTFDRTKLFPSRIARLGRVTGILMGLSVVLTVLTEFGQGGAFGWFSIVPISFEGQSVLSRRDAGALWTWQLWRWFTPMFLHLNLLHLLFNLWWLKDLGSTLERHLGRWSFLGLVLMISAPANVAQFLLVHPLFGGMSGVVYGLLGYIWIRGRLDPFCGLHLDSATVTIMGIWFFLCLFGVIPNVANTVHAVGLGMGLAFGALAARRA